MTVDFFKADGDLSESVFRDGDHSLISNRTSSLCTASCHAWKVLSAIEESGLTMAVDLCHA